MFRQAQALLFPTPEVVAELQLADLLRLQFNRQKAEYIIGLARVMRTGEISKTALLELNSIDAARKVLLKIRGVGPWTASYVLMRCLSFRTAFPIEDIGLHNALQRQLNWTRKPTIAEIKSLAAGWDGWQAYATFYLYRSLL
jgi:DNA-3-methyladenine glycosylase II